jgi:hypothetical protein
MDGKRLVFNQPILQKWWSGSRRASTTTHATGGGHRLRDRRIRDERFLRHLALGYTKEQITTCAACPSA